MNASFTLLQALFWGGFTGFALLIGSAIGYFCRLHQRVVAGIMAFGSGALISALSFELVSRAYQKGGLWPTIVGFLAGTIIYSIVNSILATFGAKHRKRSNIHKLFQQEKTNANPLAIAFGAFIDGIPESLVIGMQMINGGILSKVMIASIFISNIPEGLSSSAGMKNTGHTWSYVLGIWGGIAISSAFFSGIGFLFFQNAPEEIIAIITAIAAGAILTMVVDTMIPEAFEQTHNFAGLITVIGFLCSYILNKL